MFFKMWKHLPIEDCLYMNPKIDFRPIVKHIPSMAFPADYIHTYIPLRKEHTPL